METPDKVVLLGRGKGFLAYRDFNALSTHKVWACYSVIQMVDDVDLVFDPHDTERFFVDKPTPEVERINKKIKKLNIPIFLQKVCPEYPTSMKYPLREIVDKFGITYFSNTICYMIAYAIYVGVKQIDLIGVNQAGKEEYVDEKGGVEFWLGFALGRGLKVKVYGKRSMVLKTKSGKLYGYDCEGQDVV